MPWSRFLSLVCLTAALGGSGVAPGAQAATPGLFGVNAVARPTPAEFQRIAAGGVTTLRVFVVWPYLEPSPGTRNWQQLDGVVGDAAQVGISVLPVLYGTPRWAQPANASYTPASPPIYTAQGRNGWSNFVAAAAQRYGRSGTFWALHPEVPRMPVEAWQIWNEVNLPFYWGGRPNAHRYAALLRLTRRALSAVDPAAQIVMAGLLPYQSIADRAVDGTHYLRRFLRVRGSRKLFDVAAVHPYAVHPRALLRLIGNIRRVLDTNRARKVPIWVTEFGWTTGGVDFARSPVRTTLAQQARRVTRTYGLMKRRARRLRLQRALYFSLADTDPSGSDSWQTRMGLFGLDRQPKPAWYAYARLAGGQP